MKKLFITGASGFIGGFIVDEALKRNYEVHVAVRETSSRKYLQDERIIFKTVDFKNTDAFAHLLETEQYTHIVHNAGVTQALNAATFHDFNAEFTKKFAGILIEKELLPQKFVFMSSLASFGPADFHPNGIITRDCKPHPVTIYGRSKLAAENYLYSIPNFPFMILRPTAVFGPRDSSFLTIYKSIQNGIEIYMGGKDQQLSFIYVKDLARLVFHALESPLSRKGYFVSDGNLYPSVAFNEKIKTILNKKTLKLVLPIGMVNIAAGISESFSKVRGKASLLTRDKVHELKARNWNCDTQPLETELNFKPSYTLEAALEETIQWAKENKLL